VLGALAVLVRRCGAVEILALVLVTVAGAGLTLSRRNPSDASVRDRKVYPK
jgi:hypothetical protein